MLPYNRYIWIRHCAYTVIKHLNAFPTKNGASDKLSPNTIVTGSPGIDLSLPRIAFGAYVMVYVGTNNNMNVRSVPGIALSPSNERGGYFFMNLYTGAELHSHQWTELPLSNDVINRVQEIAL